MTAYYNEFDPFAAEWLRALIAAGHIAPGDVDTRSIVDVRPDDLKGYTQCHFFAGIGVWSYALRRAGWPDSRPIWTGSCPCQPFSAAGKGAGFDDERHLWPHFHYLIEKCGPPVVAGEQVASKDGLAWLDLVQADMEGTGYAFGAVDTCSAGFGAPHIRQRLYWIGEGLDHSASARHQRTFEDAERDPRDEARLRLLGAGSGSGSMAHADDDDDDRFQGSSVETVLGTGRREEGDAVGRSGTPLVGGMADASGERRDGEQVRLFAGQSRQARAEDGRHSGFGWLADADGRDASAERQQRGGEQRQQQEDRRVVHDGWTGPTNGLWRDADWLFCRDGKWRPVEPGTFPLAHGAPARVGRLRGYGNAINAEAAQGFIEAYLETKAIEADGHFRLTDLSGFTTDNEGIFS